MIYTYRERERCISNHNHNHTNSNHEMVFGLVMMLALTVYAVACLRLRRWVKESGVQRLLSRIREAKKAQTPLEQQKEARINY